MNALQIGRFTVFTKLNIYRFYYVYLLSCKNLAKDIYILIPQMKLLRQLRKITVTV